MEKTADQLLATPLWQATDADLLTITRQAEQLYRHAYAFTLAAYAELNTRTSPAGYDGARTATHDTARISVVEGRRRETHLDLLARSPETRAALDEGLIGADHLDIIVKTLKKIPSDTDLQHRAQAETMLVEHARTLDARALTYAARHILAWLDQDGPEPADDQAAEPANDLRIDTLRDGRVRVTAELAPDGGALLLGLLDPLTPPDPADAGRDWRAPAERRGDAFVDLLRLCANAATTPIDGGERPHLTLTMSLHELRDQIGRADLGGLANRATLTAGQARRIACDAKITPMVLDGDSVPLDVGRTKRTAPPGIRRALTYRDGGCAFPTCNRPPQWTDAHHVTHWVDGGPTTLANMTLLCRRHHTLVHSSTWEVRIRDGLPEFLPPEFIDPERAPRRNQLHGARSPLRRHCLTG
jgi:hypothetical protein